VGPKAALVTCFLAVAIAPAAGQDAAVLKKRLNNFAHENTTCGVYYTFVSVCLGKDRPGNEAARQYLVASETFFERALKTGKLAGVSDKAQAARASIAADDMRSEMDGDCTNISVLLQKHAKSCKSLFEDGPAQLNSFLR
jgi:hypothetical protein